MAGTGANQIFKGAFHGGHSVIGGDNGGCQQQGQFLDLLLGMCQLDTVAYPQAGLLRLFDLGGGSLNGGRQRHAVGGIAIIGGIHGNVGRLLVLHHVAVEVHHNRAGPARLCDTIRLAHGPGQAADIADRDILFADAAKQQFMIAFLRITAAGIGQLILEDQRDHGAGVAQSAAQAGNKIRSAGAGGGKADTGLAGQTSVTVSGNGGAVLVPGMNETDRGIIHGVVDGQGLTAGNAKRDLYAKLLHQLNSKLTTCVQVFHTIIPPLFFVRPDCKKYYAIICLCT